MVLTPIFSLEQTMDTLSVRIHIPMAKLSDVDVCIEDDVFYFSASPYYLKFTIPGSVLTDNESYGITLDKDDIVVNLKKSESCTFKDIDLIAKLLLGPTSNTASKPLIKFTELESEKPVDWNLEWFRSIKEHVELQLENVDVILTSVTYGFAGSRSHLFMVESDINYVVDLPNPDNTPIGARSVLRQSEEEKKFSSEHYLADYFEPEVWSSMSKIRIPWSNPAFGPDLTAENRHRLIVLSSRQLPPISSTPSEEASLYLGLLDLLFAYTYDYRVREGEAMTESGWNIVKLASTLSWFEVFVYLPDVVKAFYRRALTYPMIRSWEFCNIIKRDVIRLLKHSEVKQWCLKCLLDIRQLLIDYPGYHVFADLYLNDYIVWIQTRCSESNLHDLGVNLQKFKFSKDLVDLHVDEVERVGKDCLAQEKLQSSMQQMSLSRDVIC